MTAPANPRLIQALLRQPVDVTPVWMMRQAGRYLPEYRATRERAGDFMRLCKTPELACEVTLQPLARYPLDAAIVFSDILTIPDAMGLGLSIVEGIGPRFERPLRRAIDVKTLPIPDPELELAYVLDAVRLIRRELGGRVPLIGFAGSPWTLATYMVEGGSTRDFHRVKAMLYSEPALMHELLARLAEAVAAYLKAQISAGAEVVMIFDTWGGVLTRRGYQTFSLEYIRRVLAALGTGSGGAVVPAIVFTKGGGQWLEEIAACGCESVSIDWTCDIAEARRRVGDRVALQGNLDPAVLLAPHERIVAEVEAVLAAYGPGPGHVFNLGHGITPDVDPEAAGVMIQAVHELSAKYHQ